MRSKKGIINPQAHANCGEILSLGGTVSEGGATGGHHHLQPSERNASPRRINEISAGLAMGWRFYSTPERTAETMREVDWHAEVSIIALTMRLQVCPHLNCNEIEPRCNTSRQIALACTASIKSTVHSPPHAHISDRLLTGHSPSALTSLGCSTVSPSAPDSPRMISVGLAVVAALLGGSSGNLIDRCQPTGRPAEFWFVPLSGLATRDILGVANGDAAPTRLDSSMLILSARSSTVLPTRRGFRGPEISGRAPPLPFPFPFEPEESDLSASLLASSPAPRTPSGPWTVLPCGRRMSFMIALPKRTRLRGSKLLLLFTDASPRSDVVGRRRLKDCAK